MVLTFRRRCRRTLVSVAWGANRADHSAARQERHEFVAAGPVDGAPTPDLVADARGDRFNVLVARLMALDVVDLLEAVEVEREQRERRPAGVALLDRLGEVILERAVVPESGEAVGARDVREPFDLFVAVLFDSTESRGPQDETARRQQADE